MRLNRVSKNITWIVVCRVFQSLCALIINALTARYFGPSNFGIISYAASLVAFVTPLMKLGTSYILVNEIIKHPDKEGEVLGTSIALTVTSSLFCILGILSFMSIVNRGDSTTIIVVFLYSFLLFSQSIEQIQYWFHAKYLSKYISISTLVVYLIVSAYKVWLLISQKSIYWFAATNAIDHLLIALILLAVYYLKKGQRLRFSKDILHVLWTNGRPYIFPELMGLVLQQSDRIMLRFSYGDSEVGLYSAALSIACMTSFVFNAIIVSFQSQILEDKIHAPVQYEKNLIKLHSIVTYLSLAQCIFVVFFADFIVNLLYGRAYLDCVLMLKISIFYTLFSYLGSVRTVWILAENKQKYLYLISLFGMILNVVLNMILIHSFKGEGAAVATLITQIFTNVVIIAIIKPLRGNLKYMWKGLNIKRILN